jgi:hypothetical protein
VPSFAASTTATAAVSVVRIVAVSASYVRDASGKLRPAADADGELVDAGRRPRSPMHRVQLVVFDPERQGLV